MTGKVSGTPVGTGATSRTGCSFGGLSVRAGDDSVTNAIITADSF